MLLCFSHSLTLLCTISYFLLLLCVWASCCTCWSASRLLSPRNKQRSDLNSLSHGEGTVGYLSFPQLPTSTKLVRTSCLWVVCSLRQLWLKFANVFENYSREEEEEAYILMGGICSLKFRLNIYFLATEKPGKCSIIDALTEAWNNIFFGTIPLFA